MYMCDNGLTLFPRAVDKVWPKECREAINVDVSPEMNLLNECLLKGGTLEGNYSKRYNSTFYRQFLPASGSIKYDLIVASRSLFEMHNRDMRLRTLDILWKTLAPGGCMVVVEMGNHRGCEFILEAREFLLKGVDASIPGNRGKVVAPCPHQQTCPLYNKEKKYRICSDSIKYYNLSDEGFTKLDIFSYIIVQKPLLTKDAEDVSEHWPRVVQPVIRPSGQSIVRVCNQFGDLQELSVCKGKHGSLCYRVGKATQLGDLLPVKLLSPEQILHPGESLFKKKRRDTLEKQLVQEFDNSPGDNSNKM